MIGRGRQKIQYRRGFALALAAGGGGGNAGWGVDFDWVSMAPAFRRGFVDGARGGAPATARQANAAIIRMANGGRP